MWLLVVIKLAVGGNWKRRDWNRFKTKRGNWELQGAMVQTWFFDQNGEKTWGIGAKI